MATWCARRAAAPSAASAALVVVATSLAISHVVSLVSGSRVRGLAWLSVWLGVVPTVSPPALGVLPLVRILESGRHLDNAGRHQPVHSVNRMDWVHKPDVAVIQAPEAV
jgi:hypothetical protein